MKDIFRQMMDNYERMKGETKEFRSAAARQHGLLSSPAASLFPDRSPPTPAKEASSSLGASPAASLVLSPPTAAHAAQEASSVPSDGPPSPPRELEARQTRPASPPRELEARQTLPASPPLSPRATQRTTMMSTRTPAVMTPPSSRLAPPDTTANPLYILSGRAPPSKTMASQLFNMSPAMLDLTAELEMLARENEELRRESDAKSLQLEAATRELGEVAEMQAPIAELVRSLSKHLGPATSAGEGDAETNRIIEQDVLADLVNALPGPADGAQAPEHVPLDGEAGR